MGRNPNYSPVQYFQSKWNPGMYYVLCNGQVYTNNTSRRSWHLQIFGRNEEYIERRVSRQTLLPVSEDKLPSELARFTHGP